MGSNARIRAADSSAGSLGHHRLHSRVAIKSAKPTAAASRGFGKRDAGNPKWRAASMMQVSYNAPPEMKRLPQRALPIGALLFGILVFGFLSNRAQFFRSYLFAFS